jgi:hypothetical protein
MGCGPISIFFEVRVPLGRSGALLSLAEGWRRLTADRLDPLRLKG